MGSIGRKRGGLWSVAFPTVCACLIVLSSGAAAEDAVVEAAPFRVRMPNIEAAQALKRALEAADRRLADAACLEVLTEFSDPTDRTLQAALDANEVSARGYLRWIVFAQDQGSKACRPQGTVAVTEPGSRVVFICPGAFLDMARTDPDRAEASVIHEMLHSLGLGENPPRSKEITERVLERCASSEESNPSAVLRERLAANVRLSNPARAAAVHKALLGAFDSLGDAKCQGIFSDFRDASGRRLQETLDALGETGQSYLGKLVLFYEGSGSRACHSSKGQEVSAATATGSRVVFICGAHFAEGRRPKPFGPEAVIIHETLHSLGLGENPPTSDAITWKVFSRCAR